MWRVFAAKPVRNVFPVESVRSRVLHTDGGGVELDTLQVKGRQ